MLPFVSYADCNPNSTGAAAQFLVGCANSPQNAIDPSSWMGMESIKKLIVTVWERVIAFGALFAIGAIVYSGVQYTTSYGDDEKIKKAKTTGVYALIGLAILLVAFPMVNIVVEFIYGLSV